MFVLHSFEKHVLVFLKVKKPINITNKNKTADMEILLVFSNSFIINYLIK